MSAHLSCPHCHENLTPISGISPPTQCPACGAWITCPRCGTTLKHGQGPTCCTRCGHCHADLTVGDTSPFASAARAPSDLGLKLPGFELYGELGRGGMGIVFRARQLSLNREVAIKVLPPPLAGNPAVLERFHHEAALAAGLVEAHIVPVFDVLEVQGVPVIVMPLIEGPDLGRILSDRARIKLGRPPERPHPWATLEDAAYVAQILPVLDGLITTVAALHRAGVLHRDIKPSNVLIDEKGNHWLSDFGLARLEEQGSGTRTGEGMGTPGYMSPEQAAGEEEIDFRADLFSLGVTLYQALTLALPFGKRVVLSRPPDPVPPSRHQPLLPRDFDAVLLKTLEWERERRYASAAEFLDDWQRVRQGLLPQARRAGPIRRLGRGVRRHRGAVGAAVIIIALLGALAAALVPRKPLPADRLVQIVTEPAGARVVLVPIHSTTGEFLPQMAVRPEQPSPVTLRAPAGEYLVVVALDGGRFHEVYRTVPRRGQTPSAKWPHESWTADPDGTATLATIRIPSADVTEGMTLFKGGTFTMGTNRFEVTPPHERTLAPYYLDPTEVSLRAWQDELHLLPLGLRGTQVSLDNATTFVSFDEAVDYAERIGKRLPDEAEYEFAATCRGKTLFPWGNDAKPILNWKLGKVGGAKHDRTPDQPPVLGLFSNVAEWTSSWHTQYPGRDPDLVARFYSPDVQKHFSGTRIVRGGPGSVVIGEPDPVRMNQGQWEPRYRHSIARDERLKGLGFRCARSAQPRFLKP